MDTTSLKSYAPKARRDFIAAVTRRAVKFGLTAEGASPVREEGRLVLIEGQPYPKAVGLQRQKLAARIEQQGFEQAMEAAAYTWFNRLIAIRFMELHGYLDHSFRALSHPAGNRLPEILDHALKLDLPGLDPERVIDLKMDGTRDEELYRDLLLAQCHALHRAMPFLFERVDDETELLLPDNLLQTDSLIRELVTAIPEENWQEIEIIGWLYQFYISEKKDQVIGKVVKSEDIPAATQLFTPNWIVKYMVQNSLGAQWLATYPHSPLKAQMDYYIEPAEQTADVGAALAAITPKTLDPEALTLIDPACGSGHILVEAYELFKAVYLERGYRLRDIPRLILEKNLFGLDIDARAAQLTGFALMMKGRADDRRLFERGVKLNVMALVGGKGVRGEGLGVRGEGLGVSDSLRDAVDELVALFEHATTFGSLIQVPEGLAKKLPALKQLSEENSPDLFVSDALKRLGTQVRQAELLAARYDATVLNPPYMGPYAMNATLKDYANREYEDCKADTFAMFISRAMNFAVSDGDVAIITMQAWMFTGTFTTFRQRLLRSSLITSLLHLGSRAFDSISGEVVQTVAFAARNSRLANARGIYLDLTTGRSEVEKIEQLRNAMSCLDSEILFRVEASSFSTIPGAPVAYWLPRQGIEAFVEGTPLDSYCNPKKGMTSSDNARFLRRWNEVVLGRTSFACPDAATALSTGKKWFPYSKGGAFRKWYGNNEFVVNWEDNGREVVAHAAKLYGSASRQIQNVDYYFRPSVTWSEVSSGFVAGREQPSGYIFDSTGPSIFGTESGRVLALSLLCTNIANLFTRALNPTLHLTVRNVASLPVPSGVSGSTINNLATIAHKCVAIARYDWNAYERSWDFQFLPLLGIREQGLGVSEDNASPLTPNPCPLSKSCSFWITQNRETIAEMKRLEEENNRLFIDAYGLADELTPEVPIEQITLTVNPAYRYGLKGVRDEGIGVSGDRINLTPDPYSLYPKLEVRFRQDTMQELISYAIGCMMGRYRLDRPGLIYAHSGNERFWEIYDGGDRDEERGDSKKLSRSDRVAEVDGVGGTGLSDDQSISGRRAIWPEQPNSASGGIDSIEHSGGPCTPEQSGVSELSLHRSGFEGRGGNADLDSRTPGLCNGTTGQNNPIAAFGAIQNAQYPETQANPSPLIPNPYQPDADGIVPLTDTDWFEDDATHRLIEFIGVTFGVEGSEKITQPSPLTPNPSPVHLEDNLNFLADNLSPKKSESSRDTLRRYLCDSFFKDHLQTYKKRPIYWLFSSGKQKAFQCLVYLHRYNEGTLARMRMEYVVPLQSKMSARIDKLADDIQAATTSAQAKRLQKERDKLARQLGELRRFDEQLRHYADLRIKLDLDDGVKVNYGKFGDLLAEVKAVTGKRPD